VIHARYYIATDSYCYGQYSHLAIPNDKPNPNPLAAYRYSGPSPAVVLHVYYLGYTDTTVGMALYKTNRRFKIEL